ncbi:MAG TPA: sigma-70 family RNA polymerase sigma factor [Anaerolineales bacterium]|nr:sigma-70 family RNA polymerase sigma factor [Anaerolineales bacterium]
MSTPSPDGRHEENSHALDWEAAYLELLPKVFRFLWFRVGERQLAEDLASTTFEKAWRKRQTFRGDLTSFSKWVFVIARNVAAGHRRRTRSDSELTERQPDHRGPSPEQAAETISDGERVARLLVGLGPRERDLIGLKYGGGLTNRAIAELTGLSESNVGTILHRAVERLRREWDR